jgi:hypothetical protein
METHLMADRCTRREILGSGLAAAGWLASGRLFPVKAAEPAPGPASPTAKPDKNAPSLRVAIQRCESYEPKLVRQKVDAALELIGGIKKLVENKTVTIKINVTGGPGELAGLPGYRTYHIHPHVLAAL